MTIEVKIAQTEKEKNDVYYVRYKVFCEEEGKIKATNHNEEKDVFDFYDSTKPIIAYLEGKPVGTTRITEPNEEIRKKQNTALGLPIEMEYDISYYADFRTCQFSRTAIMTEHRGRGIIQKLYSKATEEAANLGYNIILGSLGTETDKHEDLELLLSVLEEKGVMNKAKTAFPKHFQINKNVQYPLYNREIIKDIKHIKYCPEIKEIQREVSKVPPHIKVFSRYGFKVIGGAAFDELPSEYTVPMAAGTPQLLQNQMIRKFM